MVVKRKGELGGESGQKAKRPKEQKKIVKLESLKQLNLNAAGLDIGATEIYAAIPEERDVESVRKFGTFTVDLNALAEWRRWRWNRRASTGYRCTRSWKHAASSCIW